MLSEHGIFQQSHFKMKKVAYFSLLPKTERSVDLPGFQIFKIKLNKNLSAN